MALDEQEEALAQLRELLPVAQSDDASVVVFASYTIQNGDSLSRICEKFGLDYQANIGIIKAINGIKDVNLIYVGQSIILPLSHPLNDPAH